MEGDIQFKHERIENEIPETNEEYQQQQFNEKLKEIDTFYLTDHDEYGEDHLSHEERIMQNRKDLPILIALQEKCNEMLESSESDTAIWNINRKITEEAIKRIKSLSSEPLEADLRQVA